MALQKTCTTQGGLPVTDAIYVIESIRINVTNQNATINLSCYKDATERTANNALSGIKTNYSANGTDFTTYFDTADASNTITEKAQDYLLNEEADFSGATEIA